MHANYNQAHDFNVSAFEKELDVTDHHYND